MSDWGRFYPPDLVKAEVSRLGARREAWRGKITPDQMKALEERHARGKYVGLALSGGGLRSATFSLGFLQSLAGLKLLHHVDYLSTVSGGSYIGGFLGALFDRRVSDTDNAAAWNVEEELDPRNRSGIVEWLRNNGRYLAPGGAADGWVALAVILRNLVAVHVVLWTLVLTVFLLLDSARGLVMSCLDCPAAQMWLDRASGSSTIWWSPALVLPALLFPLLVFPSGLAYWLVPEQGTQRPNRFVRFIALVTSGFLILFGLALVVKGRDVGLPATGSRIAGVVMIGETVIALILLAVAHARKEPRFRLTHWLKTWLVLFFLLLIAGFVDSLGETAYRAVVEAGARRALIASMLGAVTALVTIGTVVQKMLGLLGLKKGGFGVPLQLVALTGAFILLLPAVVGMSAIAHGMVWNWRPPIAVTIVAPGAVTDGAPSADALAGPSPGAPMTFELDDAGKVRFKPAKQDRDRPPLRDPAVDWTCALVAAVFGIILCIFMGNTYSFLNASSMASLYAARLTRAYLGASNKRRMGGDEVQASSMETLPSDRVDITTYSPDAHGGPLHIINTTLNETIGGQSQVEERDRKGMNLAFGPAGVSVAARHHAVWEQGSDNRTKIPRTRLIGVDATPAAASTPAPTEFRVFPLPAAAGAGPVFQPEMLDLGRWIAISGAAASTALGSMTSLGFSLLCGLLNVRLGHWWWSGVDPRSRGVKTRAAILRRITTQISRRFPVQAHLVDELLARFPGTESRNWYLTDGGHFENTGVYELIRRRTAVIVLLDNGADPTATFQDVANLVRKARVDFGVEVTFDVPPDPGDSFVGTLADLGLSINGVGPSGAGGGAKVNPKAYATVATIRYPDGVDGKLLLVKPRVTGDEPLDILNYRATNATFPQQTTADQFFDEAQWEAYRKLGNHVGDMLFGRVITDARFNRLMK